MNDVLYLMFLSRFPAVNASTLSTLRAPEKTRLAEKQNEITTPSAVDKRIRKLRKMGLVEAGYIPEIGQVYGATVAGYNVAMTYTPTAIEYNPLGKLSLTKGTHTAKVGQIAAQFISPKKYFKGQLGIKPTTPAYCYSEKYLSNTFAIITEKGKDWGKCRLETINKATQLKQAKHIKTSLDIWELYPSLLTPCVPKEVAERKNCQPLARPDLAVYTETKDGKAARLWVEVELTAKGITEYEQRLVLAKSELKLGIAYDKLIYFTNEPRIRRLIQAADKSSGANLMQEGKLIVLPITDRENVTERVDRRIKTYGIYS